MPKILVVDDERLLVKGIKFNLENEGYEVETGSDGEEAVELARTGFGPCCAGLAPLPSRKSTPIVWSTGLSPWIWTSGWPAGTGIRWSSPPRNLTSWSCSCAIQAGCTAGKTS